jgi:trimethylamine---corrinoid protein Co-methyltransferase
VIEIINSNYTALLTPRLRVLSDDQLHEIHLATLDILQRTGVDVHEKNALRLLKENGCLVKGKRVYFPPDLVNDCIASAPEKITVFDRNGKPAMHLEKNKVYYGTGSDCPYIVDTFTGERRPTVNEDIIKAQIIADSLENIDFCMSLGNASEFPQPIIDIIQFNAQVSNTTKPIVFVTQDTENLYYCIEMAEAIRGGEEELKFRPFAIHYAEPTSPLSHPLEALEKLIICARKRIPLVYTPGIQAGATGPVTIAGTLACGNAEVLSGLVIHQLTERGAPFIHGGVYTIMDMKTANYSLGGSPEWMLANTAMKELTAFYKIPIFGTAGCTDSKLFDQQAAFEASQNILVAALTGANLVHDVGYMESGLTASWDLMVACNDIIGQVKRFMQGISVTTETLAVNVIDNVGPAGHFLLEQHTVDNLRNEHWMPKLLDRQFFASWQSGGSKDMGRRVKEEVIQILGSHCPVELPTEIRSKLDSIIDRAKKVRLK